MVADIASPDLQSSQIPEAEDAPAILARFFASGGALRMLADLSEDDLARVRAHAAERFARGRIAAAQRVYFVLATLDQWSFDDWYGLGLCYQRLGQHAQALPCFAKAGVIRASDPRPPYLAGMSYEHTGNREFARKAYDAALRLCAALPQHDRLAHSARARRATLDGSPTHPERKIT